MFCLIVQQSVSFIRELINCNGPEEQSCRSIGVKERTTCLYVSVLWFVGASFGLCLSCFCLCVFHSTTCHVNVPISEVAT